MKLNNSLRFSTKTEIVLFLLVIFTEDGFFLFPPDYYRDLRCVTITQGNTITIKIKIFYISSTNSHRPCIFPCPPSFMCVHAPCFMHFCRALMRCYPSPKSFRIIRYVLEEILQSHISGLTYEPLNTQIKTHMQEQRDVQWADRPPSSRIHSHPEFITHQMPEII